ncbi:MAG: hypothetical protein EXX96DRAFT_81212 [Benjaminiella poitrasii]|nr:MAG: hypothetical protein EXX96DRAFT_81212 [Benjaminiella poitrasii]
MYFLYFLLLDSTWPSVSSITSSRSLFDSFSLSIAPDSSFFFSFSDKICLTIENSICIVSFDLWRSGVWRNGCRVKKKHMVVIGFIDDSLKYSEMATALSSTNCFDQKTLLASRLRLD